MQIYLPNEELILYLHEAILEISGGRSGVLHPNVISAAIHRPKTYLSYQQECTLHIVCAVLLDSIARNHAFSDANKRTGLMAALLTYELNGIAIKSTADSTDEFENLVLWVVKDKPKIDEIAAKLEKLMSKYDAAPISGFAKRFRKLIKPFAP